MGSDFVREADNQHYSVASEMKDLAAVHAAHCGIVTDTTPSARMPKQFWLAVSCTAKYFLHNSCT